MSDWLDFIGEHIDKIEWCGYPKGWEISNPLLSVSEIALGTALDKFQREWSAMNE